MSEYASLLKNVEKLQELGFKSEFDLSPYLLSVEDVAKKIIKQKVPNMLIKDIDMIIDTESISLNKMDIELDEIFKKRASQDSKLTPEERAKRNEERRVEKEMQRAARAEKVKKMKELYKNKVEQFKNEAKKILKDIKIAFYNFMREVKIIISKSIAAFIQAGSSIGAVSIVLAAPPWNIPLAISYTMAVVDILLNLISQLKSIIPYTAIFDQLHFVVGSKNLSIISRIINTNVGLVTELWSKLTSFESLVKKLLDFILKLLSSSNKQKIFRKVTKKLRKLGVFKDSNQTYNIDGVNVKGNSDEDATEAKDFLDTYNVDYGRKRVTGYKNDSDSSVNPEELLNKLKNQTNKNQTFEVPTSVENSSFSTYEVKLPNGTVLTNQTEEDLDDLRRAYKLVVQQIDNVTSV
jgi:hypothetical protein